MKIINKSLIQIVIILPGIFLSHASMATESHTIISGAKKLPVVELYTSQGCSSCPPADKFLSEIKLRLENGNHVLPLAFHVDYWNYLGWQDPFSKAEYSLRQRRMARINKQSTIYTPEFFVDGQETRGTKRVIDRIKQSNMTDAEAEIRLELKYNGGDSAEALIFIDNIRKENDKAELYLAIFENNLERSISSGENKGKTLHHSYVVRNWLGPIAVHNGFKHQYQLDINSSWNREDLNLAVIVKEKNSAKTLQSLASKL